MTRSPTLSSGVLEEHAKRPGAARVQCARNVEDPPALNGHRGSMRHVKGSAGPSGAWFTSTALVDAVDRQCLVHRAKSDHMDSSDPDLRHDLALRMAELARTMTAPRTLEQILKDVTTAAVQLVPGADAAGVLLGEAGRGV